MNSALFGLSGKIVGQVNLLSFFARIYLCALFRHSDFGDRLTMFNDGILILILCVRLYCVLFHTIDSALTSSRTFQGNFLI